MNTRNPAHGDIEIQHFGTFTESSTWQVWRQDDSGSQFLIEDHLTEARARAMVREFEERGHKQTYWCREERVGQVYLPAGASAIT